MDNSIKLILDIFFLILILPIARGGMSLAPFVPTNKKDLNRINRLCDLKT
ncbi:MAG: hypothetical protein LBQ59_00330 [Candidatus Peribacteria bacterium]|jgi:hypothetical protein|nr:hypothetical protein [Candidatus Peribacteria bacterium]